MRCKLLPLLLTLLSCSFLQAQTEVSGGIFDSTVWAPSGSPYIVTDDLVVFPGASLTIEPGVEVQFAENKGIELRSGSMYANGTATEPLLFTLAATAPQESTWQGIFSTAPLWANITMEFSHFTIEYAEKGIKYNGGGYRFVNDATFQFNTVAIEHGDDGYDWPTMTNCNFFNNTVGVRGRASFFNCEFSNNVRATEDLYSFANGSEGARVVDCIFTDNDFCFINNSTVINRAIIRNSTFEDNGQVATAFLIDADSSSFIGCTEYGIFAYRTNIRNCFFSDNALGVRTTETSSGDSIVNNVFTNNTIGIQLDGPLTIVRNNNICSNDSIGIYVATPNNVNISRNCWCTTDETVIADAIFDAFDDVASGIATFLPLGQECLGPLFFAGDSNSDGIANAWDLLNIGVHYGQEGPAQEEPTDSWIGVEVPDWGVTTINGLDLKYTDADGNGIIDSDDAETLALNYDLSHNRAENLPPVYNNDGPYELQLELPEVITANQPLSLPLSIGDIGNPLPDFYGIAFALAADSKFFETGSFSLDFTDSWLGTEEELIYIFREFPEQNLIEIAVVRRDGQAVSGEGLIANLDFVMSEDLIISIQSAGFGNQFEPYLDLIDVAAITHEGTHINITYTPQEITDSKEEAFKPFNVHPFPNPVNGDQIFLSGDAASVASYRMLNSQGQ
ncbi:MAG: right-handed parallel beta-helix repeat-containing protein, partial [Phaeodactylibacter sp.]|nr:right-handed parallel beta-helix repeat-containing protein [Phaeodactylibacter sp.]